MLRHNIFDGYLQTQKNHIQSVILTYGLNAIKLPN